MGQSYPLPGLHSKAFDQGMQPLVEVVRDTVGRHDAFGLACNARYYDDQGYPGHVNCTDNFNKQLAPYGIAARKGWMALNLFYNTGIDENASCHLALGSAYPTNLKDGTKLSKEEKTDLVAFLRQL